MAEPNENEFIGDTGEKIYPAALYYRQQYSPPTYTYRHNLLIFEIKATSLFEAQGKFAALFDHEDGLWHKWWTSTDDEVEENGTKKKLFTKERIFLRVSEPGDRLIDNPLIVKDDAKSDDE